MIALSPFSFALSIGNWFILPGGNPNRQEFTPDAVRKQPVRKAVVRV
jgi:hypothetical protein